MCHILAAPRLFMWRLQVLVACIVAIATVTGEKLDNQGTSGGLSAVPHGGGISQQAQLPAIAYLPPSKTPLPIESEPAGQSEVLEFNPPSGYISPTNPPPQPTSSYIPPAPSTYNPPTTSYVPPSTGHAVHTGGYAGSYHISKGHGIHHSKAPLLRGVHGIKAAVFGAVHGIKSSLFSGLHGIVANKKAALGSLKSSGGVHYGGHYGGYYGGGHYSGYYKPRPVYRPKPIYQPQPVYKPVHVHQPSHHYQIKGHYHGWRK